jgi:hypothetical protein
MVTRTGRDSLLSLWQGSESTPATFTGSVGWSKAEGEGGLGRTAPSPGPTLNPESLWGQQPVSAMC